MGAAARAVFHPADCTDNVVIKYRLHVQAREVYVIYGLGIVDEVHRLLSLVWLGDGWGQKTSLEPRSGNS